MIKNVIIYIYIYIYNCKVDGRLYIYNPYISLPRNLGSDSLIQRHSLPHPSSSYREPGSKLLVLGMGDLPPLLGNPYNGYINPYYWVDEFIP